MTKTELAIKEAPKVVDDANGIVIKTTQDMTKASEIRTTLKSFALNIKTEKDKVMRPLLDAVAAERARWSPAEKNIETALESITKKMSVYQTELARAAREQEAKLAARVEKGTLKMDTAAKKMSEIAKPESVVAASVGGTKFRIDHQLVITDAEKLPRYYLIPNEKLLLEDLKKGVSVYGAKIEEIQVPVNYR